MQAREREAHGWPRANNRIVVATMRLTAHCEPTVVVGACTAHWYCIDGASIAVALSVVVLVDFLELNIHLRALTTRPTLRPSPAAALTTTLY